MPGAVRSMQKELGMTDLLYLLATLAFFGLAWALTRACEKL